MQNYFSEMRDWRNDFYPVGHLREKIFPNVINRCSIEPGILLRIWSG